MSTHDGTRIPSRKGVDEGGGFPDLAGERGGWSRMEETLNVQVFGTKKHKDTRAALRFFSERRIKVHFVDMNVKPPSKGELNRFVQKFGVQALIDSESRRYRDLGLHSASYSDGRWMDTLLGEPLLLIQPLVRNGSELTVGPAAREWTEWLAR